MPGATPQPDVSPLDGLRSLLLFGGSFDPPHVAHVQLPELARQAIDADAVAYIPAAVSPFKTGRRPAADHHRLAMLRLALQDQPRAMILTDELDRAQSGQPSYTIDTLRQLRQRAPAATRLHLLIGGDQLRALDRWRDYREILEIAPPYVLVRPPDDAEALLASLPDGFDASAWAPRVIQAPRMDVSSTEIRRRAAAGLPLEGLAPPAVAKYIQAHRLYQSPDA